MKTNSEFPEFDALAKIYMETEWALADADNTDDIVVSDRFKKKIKRIIFFERSLGILRKVAVVFLCLLIGGGTLIAINEDVRAAVVRFFKETFDTHTEYRDNMYGSEYKYDGMVYEPTWIPDGYEMAYKNISISNGLDLRYDKLIGDEKRSIFYSCNYLQNSTIGLNTEETVCHQIEINGKSVNYYESQKHGFASSLTWEEDKGKVIYISAEEDFETLRKIFENIVKNVSIISEANDYSPGNEYEFRSKTIIFDEKTIRYVFLNSKSKETLKIEKTTP